MARPTPAEGSTLNPASSVALLARFTRPLGMLIVVLGTSLAHAQPGSDLPRSTVETISVNPGQRTQIQEFVNNWTPRAVGSNAQDTKRALEALTKPLQSRGVSVAFRQTYTQALTPLMDQLAGDGSVGSKLSMLRIAADLATPSATSRIVDMISDEDPSVRLFAVSRVAKVFDTTRIHGPAMTGSDANALINAVAQAAQSGQPELVRASVRALGAGTMLGTKDLGDSRSRAVIALSNLVGERLHTLSPSDDPTFAQSLALDAASATRQSISDISATVSPEAAKAAVRLGGDVISIALRRVVAKTIEPQSERDLTLRSVQAGETLLYFARRKHAELNGDPTSGINETKYSDMLARGDDRDFRNDAAALLGPGSPVVRSCGFSNDRFLR